MIQLDDDSIITLTDDDGNDVDFLLLDVVEYEGNDYIVLLPMEEADEDEQDDVLILKVERNGDSESYVGIEDENEMNAVFELFTAELEEDAEDEDIGDGKADE